jgi:membrane protein
LPGSGFIALLRGSAEIDADGSIHCRWCQVIGPTCSEVVGVAVTERLDRFQRKHPWAAFPLAVAYKYFDDFGTYLAALLTYYAFVSLFPLLLLLSTVLGFVLSGDPGLQHEVLTSAAHQFPVIGGDLARPKHLGGGPVGLVVGIAGSLYGGLGVAQAFQYAANTMWGVPRNNRPNPFKARGRSVLLLATAGLAVLGTTALSIAGGGGAGTLGTAGRSLTLAASLVISIAVAIFAFRFAPARQLSVRDVAAGAIATAVIWQLLQSFGVIYVRHVVEHASATNAVFALVLGLLAFLYITATAVLLGVEINVVHVNLLHPRSLLTPFTDNVTLTSGDRRAYSRQAKAQRSKGFQHVDVNFDPPSAEPGHDEASP